MGLLRFSPRTLAARLTSTLVMASTLLATGCRAQKPWPLWDSYSSKFLDAQGRVIDHSAVDRTTSEGEAYAMFFALVANDRNRFDKLLVWTESNLASGDLTQHLPAWSWGKASDGSWHVLDSNSASDADLWMAYTLCEAGRLWHVDRYSKLGATLASRVAHEEIVTTASTGSFMIPGGQGFHPAPTNWYVNPSYLPPSLLIYFSHRDPMGPWGQVLASMPDVVRTSGGFAMDWMLVGQDIGVAPRHHLTWWPLYRQGSRLPYRSEVMMRSVCTSGPGLRIRTPRMLRS